MSESQNDQGSFPEYLVKEDMLENWDISHHTPLMQLSLV